MPSICGALRAPGKALDTGLCEAGVSPFYRRDNKGQRGQVTYQKKSAMDGPRDDHAK